MIELDFYEIESFKTPDGEEWIVNPLPTNDMKLIATFTNLNNKQKQLQKDGKFNEVNNVTYDEMVKLSNNIIDKGIVNKKSGELLPERWRTPYIQLIDIAQTVLNETVGKIKSKGDGTPLEIQTKSSGKSGETSTSSKRKDGRKKS